MSDLSKYFVLNVMNSW